MRRTDRIQEENQVILRRLRKWVFWEDEGEFPRLAHLLARLKATSPIRKHLEYECAAYDWLISKAWILAISKSFIKKSLLLRLRHAKALTEEKELRTHTLLTAASMVISFWARLRNPSESTILFVKANVLLNQVPEASAEFLLILGSEGSLCAPHPTAYDHWLLEHPTQNLPACLRTTTTSWQTSFG